MTSSWSPDKTYLDPNVCKIMAFMDIIMGLGLLCCILLGFRYRQLQMLVCGEHEASRWSFKEFKTSGGLFLNLWAPLGYS